jgi:hypothetical protein
MVNRFTAEFRGGDYDGANDWEWCIIDEFIGPVGCAIEIGLTVDEAIKKAKEMNERVSVCTEPYNDWPDLPREGMGNG